jgi:NarL family two-component system response regulator LiaR
VSQAAVVVLGPPLADVPGTPGRPLRVAALSRCALTRAGLSQLLSQGDGRFSEVERPVCTGRLPAHDVVVFELSDLSGTIRNDLAVLVAQDVPVVALIPGARPDLVGATLAMGVAGTVSMEVTAEALGRALERAVAGRASELADPRLRRHAAEPATAQLSGRELMILRLIGTGLTNVDIADRLYLSVNTVKTYIRTAYRKIGVSRRAEAVLWAVHHGETAPFPRRS